MKRMLQVITLSLFAFSLTGWAQQDTRIGTWKLNPAKSKYDPGPMPKSATLKFEAFGNNGIKLVSEGFDASGKPTRSEYAANYDGKDYPLHGSAIADTLTVKRINSRTTTRVDKKAGQAVQIIRGTVSADGKTFTVDTISVNGVHNIAVYDKQ